MGTHWLGEDFLRPLPERVHSQRPPYPPEFHVGIPFGGILFRDLQDPRATNAGGVRGAVEAARGQQLRRRMEEPRTPLGRSGLFHGFATRPVAQASPAIHKNQISRTRTTPNRASVTRDLVSLYGAGVPESDGVSGFGVAAVDKHDG